MLAETMRYIIKIERLGIEEMTQLAECLPYKHESLVVFPGPL